MAPPYYADLGKQARDLFTKNYQSGVVKLDYKSTAQSGVESSGTISLNDTGKENASLETDDMIPKCGLTLKDKWNTDNTHSTEIFSEEKLAPCLKVAFHVKFVPQMGKESGALRTAYEQENVHLNGDIIPHPQGLIAHCAAVLHYQGWLAGGQVPFDTTKNRLTKTNFAVGFQEVDFAVNTNVNDGQEFVRSVFQRVNPQLQTGVQLAWRAGTNETRFGLGCVYEMDQDTSVRAKVNNSDQIGIGFTHRLRPGFSVTLSAMVDGKNFKQGGHKLGLGLDLSA